MDATTHTDPLGELLAAATQTTIRQRIKGREVSWGLEVLDPSAALEVPEVLDMLLSSAQRLLRSRPGAAGNPALAEALEAVRARDSKGRRAEETTTEEAADIIARLQRIAIRSVRSIAIEDGEPSPCDGAEPRRIWVGIMDRNTLQGAYLAAAARIGEALERVARFPGQPESGGDAGSNGPGIRIAPEPASIPAC
jgi:hypothetical protein